nr:WxL domain-containing protein [Lacticaseibacillus saniviri]
MFTISLQSNHVLADDTSTFQATTGVNVDEGQPAQSNANLTLVDGGLQVTASKNFNFAPRPMNSAPFMVFSDALSLQPSYADAASAPDRMVTVTNRTTSSGWTLSAQLSQFEYRPDADSSWKAFNGIDSLDLKQATVYQGGLVNVNSNGSPGEFIPMSQDLTNGPNSLTAASLVPAKEGNPPTQPSDSTETDYQPTFGQETKIWQADPGKGDNAWSLVFDTNDAMRLEFPTANQQVGDYHALIRWIATVGVD